MPMTYEERRRAADELRRLADRLGQPDPEPRTKTTNERMLELHARFGGEISVDFFPSGPVWRVWLRNWHHHHFGGASYGGFAGQGRTIDDAIDHLEKQAAEVVPNKGSSCTEFCPNYEDDLY